MKNPRRHLWLYAWLLLLGLSLGGCNLPLRGQSPVPAQEGGVQVEALELVVSDQYPVQVQAIVKGTLPDPCTQLDTPPRVTFDGGTFTIHLAPRPGTEACEGDPVPFRMPLSLDVYGLPAGTYRVRVGQLEKTFTLEQDNGLVPTPRAGEVQSAVTPGATAASPTPANPGRIQGQVWEDRCTLPEDPDAELPPGCRLYTQGLAGDGLRQPDEPGIPGVQVELAAGPCPGTPTAQTQTGPDGTFVFDNLPWGTYCVSVPTPQQPLGPGLWTAPGLEKGEQTVSLSPDQPEARVGFAWFRSESGFLAAREPCTLRADFVDETIPDGSEIPTGETFRKTWTVRNTGTCTWTTDYALVHTGGEQLAATDRVPLPTQVAPGQEVVLEVEMTAPDQPGTYRSEWRLEAPDGTRFGPGDQGEGKLWAEIQVVEKLEPEDLGLGSPTWVDPMDTAAQWYLLDTADAKFKVENGRLVMYGLNTDMIDSWGLSSYPAWSNGYVEATFITGPRCEGLDRYGLLVRAPDPSRGVVVQFSCDGRYRIYHWDGEAYHPLQPWTKHAAIQPGPNQTNRMGVWLQGDTLRLYANRIRVTEHNGLPYPSGQVGLVIAAERTPNFWVAVDEVAFWALP
ncbi:MAG: hypothetical protein GXO36_06195 [Chloroflexi bacterium]|nr:hypothetical protein [Chloroflexota bacterium]